MAWTWARRRARSWWATAKTFEKLKVKIHLNGVQLEDARSFKFKPLGAIISTERSSKSGLTMGLEAGWKCCLSWSRRKVSFEHVVGCFGMSQLERATRFRTFHVLTQRLSFSVWSALEAMMWPRLVITIDKITAGPMNDWMDEWNEFHCVRSVNPKRKTFKMNLSCSRLHKKTPVVRLNHLS